MSFSQTSEKTRDAYGVTYAAPTKPDCTVRFKTNPSKKSLDGMSVPNYLTEIIYNDLNSIAVGSETVNDPISVRLRVSGTLQSQARIQEIIQDLTGQLPSWLTENVLIGFAPETAPGSPIA